MLNRKYFPFERNNYYFGKLLTARDFEAEQQYANDKRRLVNRLMFGRGVAAGLGVIQADDSSLVLQAGCALDAAGREIVVPETTVVKLSTIDGYDELSTNSAYLGISYNEEASDEVFSVMSAEEGVQHNKVRESYRLTLLDESLAARIAMPMDEYASRTVIYADSEVQISQYTPTVAPKGSRLCVRTELRRLSAGSGECSFCYTLNAPGFEAPQGGESAKVALNGVHLAGGESRTVETLLTPQEHLWGGSGAVTFTITDFTAQKNGETFKLNQKLETQVRPVDETIDRCYLDNYYKKAMDKDLAESYDERLWIAKLRLIRQKNAIIVDRVSPTPFGQYACTPGQLMMLRQLSEYYPSLTETVAGEAAPQTAFTERRPEDSTPEGLRNTASGVFEFPLGIGYDYREPVFSDEIMHGLGKGPVYVDVGVEYVSADPETDASGEIVTGDVSIFETAPRTGADERLYDLSTAVKVLPERGTFVVGLRLKKATGLISLRIRWFAFRPLESSRAAQKPEKSQRMIQVKPDTLVLQPKAKAHVSPVFINMPAEACNYSVVDEEGGSIDLNGIYTAPAKEGVYEIRIEAISDPTVFTHVFAIVSQKKKDE